MSKKIKAVNIETEETTQEPVEEKSVEETEQITEQPREEEPEKVEDEPEIKEIIKDEAEKVKTKERKTVTCPKCNKVLLEKNYKYSHQAVCGKVKVKTVNEEVKVEPKPNPVEHKPVEPPPPPPPKPDYWTLRKEYANQLRERRTMHAKRLVSKAF